MVKYRHLTPEALLDLGYALHAADDSALEGQKSQELARATINEFLQLSSEAGEDGHYVSRVKTVVLSHGRGISRRKVYYLKELAEAEEQYRGLQQKLWGSHNNGILVQVLWKLVTMSILGGIGFLIARSFLPEMPVGNGAEKHDASSILIGLLFVVLGKYISYLWEDYRRTRMMTAYTWRRQNAILEYERGKIHEMEYHRAELIYAWEKYTGEKYVETPSYELVLRGDLKTREELDERLRAYALSAPVALGEKLKQMFRRKICAVGS